MKTNNQISSAQFLFIIFQTQVGVGVLSLSANLYSEAGKDGWITLLVAGVGFEIAIFIIYFLSKRFSTSTIYEYASKVVGRPIGLLISIGYIAFACVTAILVMELFDTTIKNWILLRTPSWAILMLLAITGTYLALGKLKVIGRFDQFVSFLIFPLVFMVAYTLKEADLRYILPIGQQGLGPIIKTIPQGFFSMIGFEMALFVFPYLQNKGKKALISLTLSNIAATTFYSFLTFSTFVVLSPKQLEMLPDPIVYVLKGTPFQLVDRVDLLFLSIWTVAVLTSFVSYLYIAAIGVKHLTKRKNKKWPVIFTSLVIFLLAVLPHDTYTIEILSGYQAKASYFFVLGIPLVLLIVSVIFKKKEEAT
ncbi:MAG: endospore germination permease [Anaerobacillus sp.]